MTKENKTLEINDNELNKVSGGQSNGVKTYYFGDVYKSKVNVYYVVIDQANTSGNVNCDYYNNASCDFSAYIGKANVPRVYFNGYSYVEHINDYNVR